MNQEMRMIKEQQKKIEKDLDQTRRSCYVKLRGVNKNSKKRWKSILTRPSAYELNVKYQHFLIDSTSWKPFYIYIVNIS